MEKHYKPVLRKLPKAFSESPPHFALGIWIERGLKIDNLCGSIIYIWFKNKSGMWFYAETAEEIFISGYAWNSYKWIPYDVIKNDIIRYY